MNVTIQEFGYPDNLIHEYGHWVVLLRPRQVTVGSLVVIAKSDATNLGELGADAWAEFATVTKDMERLLQRVFEAEKFNYLALMMKDPNVHFHLIPRYSSSVKVNDSSYADTDWPLKTEMKPLDMSDADFAAIKQQLVS
ncbi:MAG TPA: HIT family protein [Candidatus Saccharimonadia bacterium]|nr:HIT family protein [Candidatus Saccharimonadia bacterium]